MELSNPKRAATAVLLGDVQSVTLDAEKLEFSLVFMWRGLCAHVHTGDQRHHKRAVPAPLELGVGKSGPGGGAGETPRGRSSSSPPYKRRISGDGLQGATIPYRAHNVDHGEWFMKCSAEERGDANDMCLVVIIRLRSGGLVCGLLRGVRTSLYVDEGKVHTGAWHILDSSLPVFACLHACELSCTSFRGGVVGDMESPKEGEGKTDVL